MAKTAIIMPGVFLHKRIGPYFASFYRLNKKADRQRTMKFWANELGWPLSFFSEIARGTRIPSLERVLEFCKHFDLDISETEYLLCITSLEGPYASLRTRINGLIDAFYNTRIPKNTEPSEELSTEPRRTLPSLAQLKSWTQTSEDSGFGLSLSKLKSGESTSYLQKHIDLQSTLRAQLPEAFVVRERFSLSSLQARDVKAQLNALLNLIEFLKAPRKRQGKTESCLVNTIFGRVPGEPIA